MGNTSAYDSDSIKVLSDIEHIRLRLGMYIGEPDNPHHLLTEVLDNAIDEAQSGFSEKTVIQVSTDDKVPTYTVQDYGRGIPHGKKKLDDGSEVEIVELLCTKANSGGKFEDKNYSYSCGLHGIGVTLVNALSRTMYVRSDRDGKRVELFTDDSNVVRLEYSNISADNPSGTLVSFTPNSKYFDNSEIPIQWIKDRCRVLNAFGYRTELFVDRDLIPDVDNSDIYSLLPDYEKSYLKARFEETIDGEKIIVLLNYTNGTKYTCTGYTNLIHNRVGGTHVRLLRKAVCEAWQTLYKRFKNESETELCYEDCLVGLDSLVAVFLKEISFSSQTKEKLTVPADCLCSLMEAVKKDIEAYFSENETLRKSLIKRFEEYRIAQNRLLSQKEITSLVKVNESKDGTVKRRSVVPGLIECTSSQVQGSELYLVEGKSAAGPIARARNPKLQAVLPLRGKIKNVAGLSVKEALKSQEVCNIVNAIGCGIGDKADPKSSRYSRIIIGNDSDVDGQHIASLILCCLVNLVPGIVKAGMVYLLEAPLYGYNVKGSKQRHYTSDMSEVPKDAIAFTRYKGLGEMDDEEFRDSCLFEGKRKLCQVDFPEDLENFNRIMGTTEGRSELLSELGIVRQRGDS